MNIEYLNTFIEVVHSGSFSEVAKRFSITQPAVSFQIQKLERDLGVKLLERKQKKILVTEAGKRLLIFANIVRKENEKLTRELDALREKITHDETVYPHARRMDAFKEYDTAITVLMSTL